MTRSVRQYPAPDGKAEARSLRLALMVLFSAVLCFVVAVPASAWWYVRGPIKALHSYLDEAAAVALDGAGDVVAAGCVHSGPMQGEHLAFTVVKLAGTTSEELWSYEQYNTTYRDRDCAHSVAVDRWGDVVAAGVGDLHWDGDLAVVKLSGATGAELWRYDLGPGAYYYPNSASSVVIDSLGDVIAGGTIVSRDSLRDFAVVKLSGVTGAELWRYVLSGAGRDSDRAYSVAVDAAGDVVAGGTVTDVDGGFTVVKLSGAEGTELWRYHLSGSEIVTGWADAVTVDAAGDVVAAGSVTDTASNDRLAVVKLSGATGAELWRNVLSDSANGYSVVVDAAGDVVAGGRLTDAVLGRGFGVVKLSGATGAELWRYFTGDCCWARSVIMDGAGDVVAAGMGRTGFGVVKLSGATGAPIWIQEAGRGEVYALAADGSGNVVAGGNIWLEPKDQGEFAVAKLSGATGVLSQPAGGKRLVVKDHATNPARRKIAAASSVVQHLPPLANNGDTDPTINGAVLRIMNPTTGEFAEFALPASHWRILRSARTHLVEGYEYRDAQGIDGPCVRVRMKGDPRKLAIKVRCIGKRGNIPFTLDEPTQGELAVAIRFGPAMEYCMRFGGTVTRDFGTGNPGPIGLFRAKKADPPADPCPAP